MSRQSRRETAARRISCGSGSLVHHFLPKPGRRGQLRVSRKWETGTPAPRSASRLPASACGSAAQRGHRYRHKHSPILPLGFVDVTISASANFAALVFKQVLDPLPLAAQLHFKVIVHCHSLRGRGAGSGGRAAGMGTGEATAAAAPGNPPALHPAAAAPTRLMRQEQEEAPRERRGHPGGQRDRGRPGGGRGGSPGRRRAEERGLGVGSGCLCPCPRGLPGRRLSCSLLPRVLLPLRGAAGRPRRALLLSHSYSRLTLSHTRSHSLTHSLSHTLKQKGSAAQQPVPPQREEEGGDLRNTAAAVAKTSRRLGLPPALPPARSAVAVRPRRGRHPEDRVEGAG